EVGCRLADTHTADGIDEDVELARFHAPMAMQHGQQQGQPLRIETHREAARDTAGGREPSMVARMQLPGTAVACCDRNSADGFDTPFRPRSVIANTPSSLAAPKRFLIARTRRKLEWVSPSK